MDWNTIKQEYITEDTSYRKLAKKYGVSYSSIADKAGQEDWVKLREQWQAKALSKSLDAVIKSQTDRVRRLQTITDKILNKIEKSVDLMDECDLQAYRQVTAALKDIKEIQMLKSEADAREQEARIAKLRKDAEDDSNAPKEITINIQGGEDSWRG